MLLVPTKSQVIHSPDYHGTFINLFVRFPSTWWPTSYFTMGAMAGARRECNSYGMAADGPIVGETLNWTHYDQCSTNPQQKLFSLLCPIHIPCLAYYIAFM